MTRVPNTFCALTYLADARFALAWSAVLLAALVGGCAKRAVATVEVRGAVRLESGPWPAEGNISFVPIEAAAGFPLRPGWAVFDTSGEFSAGCFEDGDGLIPGKYIVNIVCWDVEAGPGSKNQLSKSCIPDKYQRGFQELTVPADAEGPITVAWTIPST